MEIELERDIDIKTEKWEDDDEEMERWRQWR